MTTSMSSAGVAAVERRERLARLVGEALVAGGAVVAESVVELEPADVGREARFEFGEGVDPRVGDRVDLRGRACCVSHDFEPMDRARDAPNADQ